ncbi:MAG: M28 family metallopeptidase [Verrucomicrobiota bacterium]|nr:M28 family metallopeptidase [Verrucomicrobiota bacterium]
MRFFLPAAVFVLSAGLAWAGDSRPRDPDIQRLVSEISSDRIERSIHILTSFKTRHSLSDPSPGGNGIGAARVWIRAELERISADSGGRLQVELDAFEQPPAPPRIPHKVEMVNIVATLPGVQPESRGRIYVACAHYDSRARNILDADGPAPGADDNASGVAAMLELAHVMSHYEFDATIVFLATSGGEQARNGSVHWAEQAKKRGLNIAGVLNIDAIGSSRGPENSAPTMLLFSEGLPLRRELPDDVFAQVRAGGENDFPSRQLARAIKEAAALYVPALNVKLVYRAGRYPGGGDQFSFLERGWPAVRFSELKEAFREDVRAEGGIADGDTPDLIDFPRVAEVTRASAAALTVLARAPSVPHDVQIEAKLLDKGTTLRWSPNREPDLAGYRIVWRDTTSPLWEHSLDAPKDAVRFTVRDVTKDNFIFGLEAVDAAGHASPAAYALLKPE